MPGRTCRSASIPAFIDLGVSRWQQLVGSDVTELTLSAFSRNPDVLDVDALRGPTWSSQLETGPAGNSGHVFGRDSLFSPSFEYDHAVRETPPSRVGSMAPSGDRPDDMEQALVGKDPSGRHNVGFVLRTVPCRRRSLGTARAPGHVETSMVLADTQIDEGEQHVRYDPAAKSLVWL